VLNECLRRGKGKRFGTGFDYGIVNEYHYIITLASPVGFDFA